ncbi:MAG: tRNA pseudouridine(55) synthase TruB [Nannocystaceae bacterium]|nr:tRNA pseudouridine(55) synthase TruB [Nannocystaceae bacterium]
MSRGRTRAPTRAGLLLVDKPAGPTSHDVVDWVRWTLQTRQVGHCGTLDPAATGLLVVVVGAATKLASMLTGTDKVYRASIALGSATTTADAQGEVTATVACPTDLPARVPAALDTLLGESSLPPPAFSAVHIDGTRAHVLARRGEVVVLPERPMHVRHIEDVRVGGCEGEPATVLVEATLAVSKGTYIRSLAEALGDRLGIPSHLAGLRRIACGARRVDDARVVGPLTAQSLGPAPGGKGTRWRIRPEGLVDADRTEQASWLASRRLEPWSALPVPVIRLSPSEPAAIALLTRLGHGQRVAVDDPGWPTEPACGDAAVVVETPEDRDDTLIVVDVRDGVVHPRRMVAPP